MKRHTYIVGLTLAVNLVVARRSGLHGAAVKRHSYIVGLTLAANLVVEPANYVLVPNNANREFA